MNDENNTENTKKTVSEEIEGVGNQIIERVQDLVRQGNVRRLIVKTADDKVIVDTTLTLGAVGGAIGFVMGMPFMVITTLAALVARVKVEIIREVNETDIQVGKRKVEIKDNIVE